MDNHSQDLTPEQARELGLEPASKEQATAAETFTVLPYIEPEVNPSIPLRLATSPNS